MAMIRVGMEVQELRESTHSFNDRVLTNIGSGGKDRQDDQQTLCDFRI